MFNMQFFVVSLLRYFRMVESGVNSFTENEVSAWMLLTLSSFVIGLCAVGLTLTNFTFLQQNVTRIDLLKGTFKLNDKSGLSPNPFDLGLTTNFATVFPAENWTFWLPTEGVVPADGTAFPMAPPITDADKATLFENVRNLLKTDLEKSIPDSYEELVAREADNYKDTVFQYMGEEYTLADELPPSKTEKSQQEQEILADVYE